MRYVVADPESSMLWCQHDNLSNSAMRGIGRAMPRCLRHDHGRSHVRFHQTTAVRQQCRVVVLLLDALYRHSHETILL